MPSGPPVSGWGDVKPAKTQTRAAFLAAEGGAWDFGGRLWRDCGADTLPLRLAHRYRESFCLACTAGVRIQKTAQNSNSGAFFTPDGPANGVWERAPNRRSLATERLPEGGGGGGGGGGIRSKLEFWRLFAIGHLFKSSRIQDGNAPRKYFRPAASRSHIATIILHHTACKWAVATG